MQLLEGPRRHNTYDTAMAKRWCPRLKAQLDGGAVVSLLSEAFYRIDEYFY